MGIHREPFVHLAGLTHKDALIAWGAFFFHDEDDDGRGWRIVEDPHLPEIAPGDRRSSIGVESPPFGRANVEVVDLATGTVTARAATATRNHVWVRDLQPDTAYHYRIAIDGEPWAEGAQRAWQHTPHGADLIPTDRVYDTTFRTFPAPDVAAPLRFAVLGDYGVGILEQHAASERQRRLAAALERAVDHAGVRLVLTTGDNVYLGAEHTVAGTGNEDDDWYYSFYEPYRHVISRVPVYPGVGNHDTNDTEHADDRGQLADNMFTDLRFAADTAVRRASVDPGLFYTFSYGAQVQFVAVDSTVADEFEARYFVHHPRHKAFLEEVLVNGAPGWRIPFSHHPPYCAGPKHGNAGHLTDAVVPLLQAGGVRVMFSGHEHNFQHNHVDGIDYIVTGAAGKLRVGAPDRCPQAGTRAWADEGHILIVDIEADCMTIHPVTDVGSSDEFTYVRARTPSGDPARLPIVVDR